MHRIPVNMKPVMVIVLLLGLLLPFAGKAFHIDDTVAIYTGRHILKSPLKPFDFNLNWYGKEQSMWLEDNPPLIYYYVAAIILMFGESEASLHLSFLIFPVIAAIGMYFLGKRFTKQAILCVILMIAAPAFLVMSTNIMLDVPLLAFYIALISTFVYGVDRGDNRLKILSGILMGFAVLTKYTGLTLIPLLMIYVVIKDKNNWKSLWIFLIPIFIFTLWCIHNLITNGSIHFIEAAGILNFKPDALHQKLIGTLSYLGGATVFPLLIPILLFKKRIGILIWIFALFFAILLPQKLLTNFGYRPAEKVMAIFFIWVAIIFLIKVIERIVRVFGESLKNLMMKEDSKEKTDDLLLLFWFLGIFLLNVIAEYAAVRFVLIMLPPIILLGMRMVEEGSISKFKQVKVFTIAGLLLLLALSISVVYADYNYANVYRLCVNKINGSLKGKKNNIYFSAHWGFQYYMEKEGFKCFSAKIDNPQKSDILIIPYIASYDMPIDVSSKEQLENYLGRRMRLINIEEYNSWFPVRTMHKEIHAGFYSHGWGFLPFVFSKAYLEKFYIWEFI